MISTGCLGPLCLLSFRWLALNTDSTRCLLTSHTMGLTSMQVLLVRRCGVVCGCPESFAVGYGAIFAAQTVWTMRVKRFVRV